MWLYEDMDVCFIVLLSCVIGYTDIQDLLGPDLTDPDQQLSGLDTQYQCLKWQPHNPSAWYSLLGSDLTPAYD